MKLVVSSISFKSSTDQTNMKQIINLFLRLIFQLLLLRQLKFFHFFFFFHVFEAPVKLVLQIVFQGSFIIIHDLSYENQVLDLYLLINYQTIKRDGIFQNFTIFLIIPPNLALAEISVHHLDSLSHVVHFEYYPFLQAFSLFCCSNEFTSLFPSSNLDAHQLFSITFVYI